MGKPKAQAVPDPAATAAAQATANKDTAIAQAGLNNVNQITPTGSLTYQQIGTWPDGTPRYQATTALSPLENQADQSNQMVDAQLGQLGVNQLNTIGNVVSTPFNANGLPQLGDASSTGRQAVVDALTKQAGARLDPQWAMSDQQFQQRMADQGIPVDSDAYRKAAQQQAAAKTDAYQTAANQAETSGMAEQANEVGLQNSTSGQALSQALTVRNQPINELAALLGTGGVQQPTFQNTPQTNIAPTDVIGATALSTQVGMNNLNQQNAARSAVIGALGSAAGTAGGAYIMHSDRRLKTAIKKLGTLNGINIYEYAYKWAPTVRRVGVMAQEILKIVPQAVRSTPSGLVVDYGMLKPWLA